MILMARSLNTQEAEVFNAAIDTTQNFPLFADYAESLLKRRDEALELAPESGIWFGNEPQGLS